MPSTPEPGSVAERIVWTRSRNSPLRLIFENEIGVGQTMLESFMRETNTTPAAKSVVVVGYGWCGRGIAKFFRDFGGLVTVVDTDPVRALHVAVRGYEVRTLLDAATTADMLVTVTGHPGVIGAEALSRMPDGAIVANAGHFGTEIDIDGLEAVASEAQACSPRAARTACRTAR